MAYFVNNFPLKDTFKKGSYHSLSDWLFVDSFCEEIEATPIRDVLFKKRRSKMMIIMISNEYMRG